MPTTRIYHAIDKRNNVIHLVRAASRAQAQNHLASQQFEVNIATQDRLLNAVAGGVTVVDANPISMSPA